MSINSTIRVLRMQKHISQESLGELLGISGQAVSKWEQGLTSPDISLLPMIADCFGVTIDSLFRGVPSRKYPGYGTERSELYAAYTSEQGTDADFCKAENAYAELILSGKATAEDYICYGLLHRKRASRDEEIALHAFKRAIAEGDGQRDMQWMHAHQALTNLLCDLGRTAEAVDMQRKWCTEEPDCAWAHVSCAYALDKADQLNEACEEIEKALLLSEQDVNAHTLAGDLFAKAGRCDKAIAHWDRAFALDESCISSLFSKAEMFASLGQNEKAIAQFEEILAWLESHGYNMALESAYPLRRIEELRGK